MTDELIGKRFGGYEILSLIGRGGMATVYRAQQVSMNRMVALKILPRQFLNDENYMMRFNREVTIIAQLEHRGIVPVHDYGEHESQPYIVMRYLAGGSVDDLLNGGVIPLPRIVQILDQIAPALDYAHSQQVLHRDIKPSNVLLDGSGGAFLTDFGIARIMGDPTISTDTQGVIGTPSYMSPEQAQGQPLDNRSDIYSLGVMLYEMATGRRPFESDTPYGVAVMQVTALPPAPRGFNPALPPAVESVILAAMHKRREDRFLTAEALANAFRRAVEGSLKIRDTDPAIPRPSALDAPLDDEPTMSTPPPPVSAFRPAAPVSYIPQVQPAISTPPPPPSAPVSSASIRVVPPLRRRSSRGWWIGGIVGILIGCGLLTIILLVAAVIVLQTRREEESVRAVTETAAALADLGTDELPTPARASSTRSTEATSVITPSPLPILPAVITPTSSIGVRETGIALTGQIIYSAERASNGRAIAPDESGDYNLYLLDLATRAESRLSGTAYIEIYPSISPDRTEIAFVVDRGSQYDLWIMSVATRAVRRLTFTLAADRAPTWSPDGGEIIFSSDTNGTGSYDLYSIPRDGGEIELVYDAPFGQRASDPMYTRDGRYLLFTLGDAGDARTWEIMRLDPGTGDVIALTENDYKDWQPVPAPDGSIVYLTESINGETLDSYSGIAAMTLDGMDTRLIYDGVGYESSAFYSPDGALLIFTSDHSGRDEVYALPTSALSDQDAVPEQVSSEGAFAPAWLGE